MNTLIIVAHGSRVQSSNEEIINFSNKIQEKNKNNFIVRYAFLELATPCISDVISDVFSKNTDTKIKILPYFLAEGKHVKIDIPNEVKLCVKKHTNINIEILPHIGKHDGLVNLIVDSYS